MPLKAPASRPDAPEIAPTATQSALESAPAAEPNEADILPALDSGREKLLSSTESEDVLNDHRWLVRTLCEITKPFLKCRNAVPTREPQPLKGTQAAEKGAAVLPGKAPSAIKTYPPPTQKPVAKAKAPAPPKTQVSVLMAAFIAALAAMSCSAFGSVDVTCFASARGAQPVLYTNTTGDLDVVACHPGICFDPLSDMADGQSSVLSSGIDLLHREAVMRCRAAGLMPEAVHAKMLPPTALGFGRFRHAGWHQNAIEGMPCTPKSLPCMHYLKLPVPTIGSNSQLGLHDSGMSSSLTVVKEAGSAGFGSLVMESASLAEQVTATARVAAPSPRLFARLPLCTVAPRHASVPLLCTLCTQFLHLAQP